MDAYLSDPRLKALFAALWPYLGLPHTTPIRGLYLSGHWTSPEVACTVSLPPVWRPLERSRAMRCSQISSARHLLR